MELLRQLIMCSTLILYLDSLLGNRFVVALVVLLLFVVLFLLFYILLSFACYVVAVVLT